MLLTRADIAFLTAAPLLATVAPNAARAWLESRGAELSVYVTFAPIGNSGFTLLLTAEGERQLLLADGGDEQSPHGVFVAAGPVSAHRGVKLLAGGRVTYCDALTLDDMQGYIGMSTTAGSDGDAVTVQYAEQVTEPSWAWTPGGLIYTGAAGALTQVFDPSWAWVRAIGVAVSTTSIWLRPRAAVMQ